MVALLLVPACQRTGTQGASRDDTRPSALRRGVVVFQPAGRTVRVTTEVAATPESRSLGLMFRKRLEANEGMLFVFEREEAHPFWMKNTYIGLDMIFIDNARRVVGIIKNAQPLTTTTRSVVAPSRYVVEVNAGFAQENGIEPGTKVQLPDDSLRPLVPGRPTQPAD